MDQRVPAINAIAFDWGCCPHWHADWARTGRRIVGAATREQFNEFAGEIGAVRLPREPAYHLVLLHPYYDAPGRISGFQVLGRGESRCINVQYVDIHETRRKPNGLTMLDTALRVGPKQLFGDIFVAEWETAFRLQIKHLRTSLQFLPLMAPMSWEQRQAGLAAIGRRRLRVLPDRDRLTPELTIFAKRHDGGVVHFGYDGLSPKNASKRSPFEWLQAAQQRTQGWHGGVIKTLGECTTPEATTFLLHLGLTKQEQEELLHRCDGPLRERLAESLPLIEAPSEIAVGGLRVRETALGWTHITNRAKSQQLLTGIVRCDRIIAAGDRTQVIGRVLRAGAAIPFTLPERTIRRDGLFFALRDYLRKYGTDLDFLPYFNNRAWSIATAFYRPQIVHGSTSLGWDAERNCFHLPSCTILADGKVEAPATILADEPYPGRTLASPGFLINRHAEYLASDAPCVALIWSLALTTIRSLISPVMRLEDRSVALTGAGCAAHGTWISQQLGCIRAALPPWTPTTASYQQFAKHIAQHGWPVHLDVGEGARPWTWVAKDREHSLLPLTSEQAAFAATRGWDVIHAKLFELPQSAKDAVRHIVPNYLQNICKRRLPLPPHADLPQLLDDMSNWWRESTGHALPLRRIKRGFPYWGMRPADVFREAMQLARLSVDDKQSAVLISQRAIGTLTKSRNLPLPNYLRITQALQAAGVLLDVHESTDDTRWAVQADWWYDRCTEATEATD